MTEPPLTPEELDVLADLLAGEGTEEQVATLAASPALAQALADLDAADALVRAALAGLAAQDVTPPDGFDARLRQALEAEGAPPGRAPATATASSETSGTAVPPPAAGPAAETAAETVVPFASRRAEVEAARHAAGGPNWPLRVAAGVIAVGLIAGLGVLTVTLGSGSSDDSTAASPAIASSEAQARVPTSESGRDYRTAGTLQAALPALLTGTVSPAALGLSAAPRSSAPSARPPEVPLASGDSAASGGIASGSTGSAAGTTGGSSSGTSSGTSSETSSGTSSGTRPSRLTAPEAVAALARLRDPAALQACYTALELPTGVAPEALDYARYAGAPALVIVLPVAARPEKVEAYVVGASCGSGTDDLLFYGRLDRP